MVLKMMHEVGDEVLVLVKRIPNLGPFLRIYEVGIGVAYLTLSVSLSKGIYLVQVKLDSISKAPTEWRNLY